MHTLAQTARQRTKRSSGCNVFVPIGYVIKQLQTANTGQMQTDFDEVWKILAVK